MEHYSDNHIENLKTKLYKMSSLVDEQVQLSIKGMEEQNAELSKMVIERDDKVDGYEIKIEKICQMLFALTQPVALNLRIAMSALKININLERIGDLAANIAKANLDIGERPDFYSKLYFSQVAALSRDMVKDAIDAVIESNADLALKVLKSDNKIDDLVKENIALLEQIMMQNPQEVKKALLYYRILLNLERLGDHATNISEEVYFIVSGKSIKHSEEF